MLSEATVGRAIVLRFSDICCITLWPVPDCLTSPCFMQFNATGILFQKT